jgi:hypothetical protein
MSKPHVFRLLAAILCVAWIVASGCLPEEAASTEVDRDRTLAQAEAEELAEQVEKDVRRAQDLHSEALSLMDRSQDRYAETREGRFLTAGLTAQEAVETLAKGLQGMIDARAELADILPQVRSGALSPEQARERLGTVRAILEEGHAYLSAGSQMVQQARSIFEAGEAVAPRRQTI